MREVLDGKGTLRQVGPPPAESQVQYRFIIDTPLVARAGFPPAMGKSQSEGTVTAINGDFLPQDYFQLIAKDGEIMRVQNVGFGTWKILSPMA
jgi:hypothetical protein